MNLTRSCSAGLAVAILLTICVSLQGRPWTDSTGKRTVEAEFVSLADGKVTLKKADGKTVTIALDKLSAADQKVAKELAAKKAPAPAGDASGAKVELISLSISKAVENSAGMMTFAPMVNGGGTSMTFQVTSTGRHFVGFDEKASKIVAFTDDQGTDLAAGAEEGNSFSFSGPFSASVSPDGKACQASVTVQGIPKTGASKLSFDGTLAIRCGKNEKTEEQKDVALEPKTEITVGPTPLTIEAAEDQDFGEVKFMLTLNSSKPRDAIKLIEFLDEKGNAIESESMGGGSFGFGDEMTYQTNHGLKAKPDKVTVRITYYSDMETIEVPVKIETGVGF